VETRLDAVLWGDFDEHRQLLVPSNYVGRGAQRVMLVGPSECREAFLPVRIEAALPGLRAYQNSLSLGMFSDVLLILEYLERAHGEGALPRALVVGLTARFTADIGAEVSPLAEAIDAYSPVLRVVHDGRRPGLAPRGALAGLLARLRFLSKQGLRYRNAVRATRAAGPAALLEPAGARPRLGPPFAPARYQRRSPWSREQVRARLDQPNNFFRFSAAFDYAAAREAIVGRLERLRAVADRSGIRLLFVVMPERSEHRALYPAGAWETYLDAVRAGVGDAPLLDLRTLLDDGEFYDANHPTRAGAQRVSARVGAALAQMPGLGTAPEPR